MPRTLPAPIPVNGRFSPPQRELYELVLAAQAAAIAKVVPGNRWIEPHEAAVKTLTRGLVDLGLLAGGRKAVPKLIRERGLQALLHAPDRPLAGHGRA